ncbi:phage integrase family protein [mine drainage metagenome]|uniref:Phage integrase family protein n=1 Tax=mine drainage metagenome TaxID=410659 RepID=A0A1J5RS17_9ZZZZ
MPNGTPAHYTPIAVDEPIDFASKLESTSSELLTSALPKGWEAALAWSKSCGVLNELLVLLDATLAWDHPNVFGNLLSHISSPICMEMLEESAQTEFAAKVLWKLAFAASKKPTILPQYPRLTDKVAASKQFKGDTPTLYIIALIVERSPPGTMADREWFFTLRLWVLTHAINRAKHENIQDQHLRLVAQKIRLGCAEADNWRKLFLSLRTTALDFDALNRHLSHKSEKLISAHSLKSTEIQVLRTLIKVANRESSQDATTHVKPRYLDTAKLLADKLDKISRPEFRTIIEDDDQSPGAAEYIQASEDGESDDLAQTKTDETRSYAHQRLRSTGILLYDSEDLQHLPWSWGRPNRFEMSRLDEWTTQNLTSSDEKVSTLAGVTWIAGHSGRSMRRALDIKITAEISSEWCLHPNCRTLMRLPPQRIPGWDPETDEDKAWVTPMATSNTLHLPDEVAHVFQERLKRMPDASCIGELWDTSWENSPESAFRAQLKHDIPRLTPGMLGSVLPQRIFSASGDATFARLLSSHPNSALPGASSYAAWTTIQVGQALTGQDENPRPHLVPETINAIGSRLDPIEELLVQAIHQASKKLDVLRHDGNPLAFHNAYVAYLTVALLAATGGRPIIDPFETIAHFDFQQSFVFINDKVSGKLRQGRLVPLPQELCELIQSYYLPHLAKLALALQEANPILANEISILATGKLCSSMPFLFFMSPEITWTSVSEKEITRLGLFNWPLPLNLFRHRLATRLRREFVNPEIIDSILGHGESGATTHGDYSFRIWIRDMSATRLSLEKAFRELGFLFINSWDGAPPQIAPTSRSENVDAYFSETISFGSKAREQNRKVQMFSTIRDARLQLEQFLGTRSLADLTEDEIDVLTRKLLFKGDGLPHPSGFLKYQYLMRRIERLWKKKGKRVRLTKRFMPRIQEESPFTEFAPGAMAIFHELQENMAAISKSIRPGKLSLRDCSVIAAVLLCIENRISSKVILGDVLRARNFWLANLKGVFYFEHSSRLSTSETEAPVQRFQISTLSAVLIDRLLDSKNVLAARQPIPDFLHPFVDILANTERFAEITSADELINVLGPIVAQVNSITDPGILAGYRDGRVKSYSLKRQDWLRAELGYAVQVPARSTPDVDEKSAVRSPHRKPVSATALISQSSVDDFAALQIGARSALNKVSDLLATYQSILPTKVTAKDRESLARKLRDIAEDKTHSTSSAIQLLVRWAQSLVHRPKGSGFINVKSIGRYLVALSPSFDAVGYAADLLKMDDEDVTIFYSEVLETSKERKVVDTQYVARCLVDFHRWAKKKYAIEEPAWEELPETYAAAGVSPGLITEKEYQDALLLLLRLPENRLRHRLAPAVLLLLCYRFGLRGSEALGLLRSDVVMLEETMVVLVQNNRFRNLKTVTSRRQVPLVFSLSGTEKRLLDQWLAEFAATHGSNGNAPLFFAEGTGQPLMAIGPIKFAAISVLKLVTYNSSTNLHHARHTAANFVGLGVSHLKLDMWIHAGTRSGQSTINIEQILLSKPQSRSRMWAVSRFLGHVRGQTTCGSYLHFFGDWANSLFQPITSHQCSTRLVNATYLDDLPRIATIETDLLDSLTPKFEGPTPLRMLKWLHLIAQGQSGTASGAALTLDPKFVEESLGYVTSIGKKIRLSQKRESQLSAANDSEEKNPMEFLHRIKEPAWQRLLHCFVEAELEPNVIPSSTPSIPLTDLIMMVGATRQLLMWNDEHFLLMRSLLDYFNIDDGRFNLVRSNTANSRILDLVSKYRFRSLSQLEAAKAFLEFRKKKRIAKELEVGESEGTSKSQRKVRNSTIQLDSALAGEFQVLKRCAFLLAESDDFTIRNSVEFVVVFTAFTLSVRTLH